MVCIQCSISRVVGDLTPPLVENDPLLVTVKFGLGVGFDPRKIKAPNSSLNRYKLMSDIIQTHPRKLFVMVCRLTASQLLLLCLITFKQSLMSLCCFLFNCYAFALL